MTWSEDESLGERYVAAIGVPGLTAEHARRHLEVERRLVAELRSSSPENRTATFRRCYDELFRNLPWLQRVEGCGDADRWVPLLGDEPLRVHEVGSGTGTLARRLARAGHVVEASDISGERGDWTDEHGVRWVETDGVHLDRFATRGPYDVVVSDQVVEHLHPDDIATHAATARKILGPGGRYLVRTPHRACGPHDVSRVFGFDEPIGTHLHEYDVAELRRVLLDAGFARVLAVVPLPRVGAHAGRLPLAYQLGAERLLEAFPWLRRPARRLRGPLRVNVWLDARA